MVLLAVLGFGVPGRADVTLLTLDGVWRWNEVENLDATGWQASGFDDAAWPVGTALFYVETNALVAPRNTPLIWGRSTYYFRTHFQLPVAPTNLSLLFSIRIDDGAVFYLNGREIWRRRMPTSPVVIPYDRFASGTPTTGDSVMPESLTLSGGSLTNAVRGDNVLAVELHPRSLTNDNDVVFGTAITLRFVNSPPVFLLQPTNLSVLDGRPAQIAAWVEGDPAPVRQWYRESSPIPGATNSTLDFSRLVPEQAGTYWLVASNALGMATSSNVVVTVLPDPTPPAVLVALARLNLTNVDLTFSEPISPSSVSNLAQYELSPIAVPANRLLITSAVLRTPTNLVLTTASRTQKLNYSLRVSGVSDISSSGNRIAEGTYAPLEYEVSLVGFDSRPVWRYEQTGRPAPSGWAAVGFDDGDWPIGAPLFLGPTAAAVLPETGRTVLATAEVSGANPVVTHYFRTAVDLPGLVRSDSLRLRGIVDDGAVFHFNGGEVFAVGVPQERPLAHTTLANRLVAAPFYEPPPAEIGWPIQVGPLNPAGNVLAAELHQTTNSLADAVFGVSLEAVVTRFDIAVNLTLPATLMEGSGLQTGAGRVGLLEPRSKDTRILLESSDTALGVPTQVIIPAGFTNVGFDLTAGQDLICTGPRRVTVRAQGDGGGRDTAALLVLDDEAATLALTLPAALQEGKTAVFGELRVSQPFARALHVDLVSSLPERLAVPSTVTVPAGATSAPVTLSAPDNGWVEGKRHVTVAASVPGWAAATAGMDVLDDEVRWLQLDLPSSVVEGSGSAAGQGTVRLSGRASSPVTVALTSSSPARLALPASVVISAGSSNAVFALNASDNSVWEGPLTIQIAAVAETFTGTTNSLVVLENDAHHFNFSSIASPQTTDAPFQVTVRAEDPAGALISHFTGTAPVFVRSVDGDLTLEPTEIGPFVGGSWTGQIRVTQTGRLARLSTPLAPGDSPPFHVEPPVFRLLSQATTDLLWHEPSQTLLASVASDAGVYADQIVAIDPVAGLVTDAYPIGRDPTRLEMSGDGSYAYVALSNSMVLRRFDLGTRQAGLQFDVGSNFQGPLRIGDFAVIGGAPDSVAARLYDSGANDMGVWRFDGGNPAKLDTFSAYNPSWIEAAPAGELLYAFENINLVALIRGLARPGSSLIVRQGVFDGGSFTYRDGVLFSTAGRAVSATSMNVLGTYPGVLERVGATSLLEVDPPRRRVFYFAGYFNYGRPFYRFKAYDRDSFTLLNEVSPPDSMAGVPIRLLRWATNGLVFNTSGGQIWFVRSEALQPTQVPCDLGLAQVFAPATPVVADSTTLTLTVSNAGPGLATLLRITNALPVGATVVALQPTTGTARAVIGGVAWDVPSLDPGAATLCQITLRLGIGGWITNTASVSAYEPDPAFANNVSSRALYVEAPPEAEGAFQLQLASEDLLYDPARDRLLLSVGAGSGAQQNGLAIVNPYSGAVETFLPLGARPGRLARAPLGETLYVSFPETARVRCLDLASLVLQREFVLGGEFINDTWYPFYAADLAVPPGQPDTVLVWRVRRAGPEADEYGQGIAAFDSGVMRPGVTESGGRWSLEFNTDDGTLFAYYPVNTWGGPVATVYRCALTSSGVAMAEAYPALAPSVGTDFEYAAGKFFLSGGAAVSTQPFGVTTLFEGTEGGSLVEPDAAAERVFFLGNLSGGWRLRAHEMSRGGLLGGWGISGMAGTPTALVRCGTAGLAFRTSGNQLWLVRGGLINPAGEADLAVSLDAPSTVVPPGAPATLQLVVTNRGPIEARGVVLTNRFSPPVPVTTVTADQGEWNTNASSAVWSVPTLPVGGHAAITVTVNPTGTGAITMSAELTSTTVDSRSDDNAARRVLLVGAPWQAESALILEVPACDLAWSAARNRLFLTGSTNAGPWAGGLISVDPGTLQIRKEMQLGLGASRLIADESGSRLLAALGHAVARVELTPALTRQSDVLLDSLGALYQIGDLEVLRGAPASFSVGRTLASGADVCIFDGDVRRTNTAALPTSGFVLEAGATPSTLYAHDFHAGGVVEYSLDPQGVVGAETTAGLLPWFTPLDLAWGDGLLFSSLGHVVDPASHTPLGSVAEITSASAVCYDAPSRQVCFASLDGPRVVLRTVDPFTLLTTKLFTNTDVRGTPIRLVRWGTDGLAFLTRAGELGLVRSGLIPSGPPADLGLGIGASATHGFVGSNIVYTLTVTNLGPNAAADVRIVAQFSANSGLVTAVASQGICSLSNAKIQVSLGSLAAGGTAEVEVTAKPTEPGTLGVAARAISAAVDPSLANNQQGRSDPILQALEPRSGTVLSFEVSGLVHDPHTGCLYAAGPGARISVVQPSLAFVADAWSLPGVAGPLSLSEDGTALYVVIDSANRLVRLDPASGQLTLELSSTSGLIRAVEPLPQQPHSFVLAQDAGFMRAVQVYDDGVARPTALGDSSGADCVVFGGEANIAYANGLALSGGRRLRTLEVDASGIREIGWTENVPYSLAELKFAGGRLYAASGQILDPGSGTVTGEFGGLGSDSVLEVDPENRRAFFLTRQTSGWQLQSYDTVTGGSLAQEAVPGVLGTPSNLVRWGEDGLAFCTTSNQLFLLRSRLLPEGPPGDVQVRQWPSVPVAEAGSNLVITLNVTNAGPSTVSNVVVLGQWSAEASGLAVTTSRGTALLENQTWRWDLGTLTHPDSAQAQITIRPNLAGLFSHSLSVVASNPDPDDANNVTTAILPVRFDLPVDQAALVALNAIDLEYDAVSDRIYATSAEPGDSTARDLVTLEPDTGLLDTVITNGSHFSQLAVSSDGSRLFVVANRGTEVHRLGLPAGICERILDFGLSQSNDPRTAGDIEPLPDRPTSLAVVVEDPAVLGGGPSLVIYDEDVPRVQQSAGQRAIEFFAPDHLLGYEWQSVPSHTSLLELTDSGASEIAWQPYLVDGDMADSAGRIYTSGGSVIDPASLTRLLSFGVTGPVAPDAAANRVSFLTGTGTTRVVRIFDLDGLAEWGTVTITNVLGEADDLVRCGADRLAFRTTAGQVFVLRSSALPFGAETDLALAAQVFPMRIVAGETFELRLSVSNLGPNDAGDIVVTQILPPGVSRVSVIASQGVTLDRTDGIDWQVGSLTAGGGASNRIFLTATRAGWLGQGLGQLRSSARDPDVRNNLVQSHWTVELPAPETAILELTVPAADLAWNPVTARLYASLPASVPGVGNSLIALDPLTGALSSPIPVGPDPGRLVVSDDGQFLYVGLNGSASVARVRLSTTNVDLTYALNTGYQARDLAVMPGKPGTVAVAREYYPWGGFGDDAGTALYQDGSELPLSTAPYTQPITSLAWSTNGTRLYGFNGWSSEFGFRRLNAGLDGLSLQDVTPGLISGYSVTIASARGLVFASSGAVLNPENLTLVTNLPGISIDARVTPDFASGLLSFVTSESGIWSLRQYDHGNYSVRHQFRLPGLAGKPLRLVPWGGGRLAVLTSGNQVLLLRPDLAYADLRVSPAAWPTQSIAGQTFQVMFAVTNHGPASASDTWVTNSIPPGLALSGATLPPESYSIAQGTLRLSLGALPPGSGIEITLDFLPTNSVTSWITNSLAAGSAFEDTTPANATWDLRLWAMADNDRDQVPDDWEIGSGLNPANPGDALQDPDGDGASNLEEYLAGTDPRSAASVFRILRCVAGPDTLRILVAAAPGGTYSLEASSSLDPGAWSPITTDLPTTAEPIEVVVTNVLTGASLFIRARLSP